MSSVFLFGAGASYGSGECSPSPPPLGRDLFGELQKANGLASTIRSPLADIFAEDFEKGMAAFFRTRNVEVSHFLRDLAAYFARFEPGPTNLYRKLVDALSTTKRGAVLATANYDLLIERSISQAGLKIAYTGPPVPADNFPVLKIHGSCNFLPDLAPSSIRGLSIDISRGGRIVEAPVRIASPREVLEFCQREDFLAPAIALYAEGKAVLHCSKFVQRQQKAWQDEARNANRIFVIGLRVNPKDSHIWGPLASSRAPFSYVGHDADSFRDWCKNVGRRNATVLGGTFREAFPLIARQLRW